MQAAHNFAGTLSQVLKTLKLLYNNKIGFMGFIIVVGLVMVSFVGPLVVPPETKANVAEIYQSPSASHPLGTDFQGRDNLVMVIHGGRDVMVIAFLAGILTTLIAVSVGAFSAFFGGAADSLLMAVTDVWLTLPRFILLLIMATLFRLENAWMLAVFLAVFTWPSLARQIRSQVLSLKKREYVEAARLLGLGAPHIVFREMLPNMMAYVVIALINAMIEAIYSQTGLVFLGVVPFGNNWGVMYSLAYAKSAIYNPNSAWSLLAPMGAIIIFQMGLVSLSRSIEEIFNPRLRTGV